MAAQGASKGALSKELRCHTSSESLKHTQLKMGKVERKPRQLVRPSWGTEQLKDFGFKQSFREQHCTEGGGGLTE